MNIMKAKHYMVFLPKNAKPYSDSWEDIRKTEIEGDSPKYLISIVQKYQDHERQEKME